MAQKERRKLSVHLKTIKKYEEWNSFTEKMDETEEDKMCGSPHNMTAKIGQQLVK